MKMKYCIAGDGTGITYGVHKREWTVGDTLIKGGFKSFKEAEKYIKELENKK